GWLSIDAPVTDRIERADLWGLLTLNASLAGLSKFVLMPDHRSVHVRCDLSLADDDYGFEEITANDPAARVQEECAGMKNALARFHNEKPSAKPKSNLGSDNDDACK